MRKKLINIDREIMSGTPVFYGTRISDTSLFDWLKTESLDDFFINFLSVTNEQVVAVLKLPKNLPRHRSKITPATSQQL